jgi:hypothetical protein
VSAVDYAIAPKTDDYTTVVNEMISRRPPRPTMRTETTLREFVKNLNDDLGIHPVGDLLVGAHANSEGQLYIQTFPGQLNSAGEPTSRTEFEHLEQTLVPGALTKRIRIDDHTIDFTTPPPTHFLHFKGCNLGKAVPFVTKLKQALGDHVNVTAPKHFHGVVKVTSKGNGGYFEYMCYEFQVQVPATLTPKGALQGFATRADLIDAFDAAAYSYIDGAVPKADWDTKWVPTKDVTRTQTFLMSLPLGATVAGLKAIAIKPMIAKKKVTKGSREFRVNQMPSKWKFAPTSAATTYAARVAELRTAIARDPRFDSNHVWPMYVRAGFSSLDDYMDGHLWNFGAKNAGPITTGVRFEYTVVLPIIDNSGPKPKLFYNFYPAPGSAQAAIPTGILQNDARFYLQV